MAKKSIVIIHDLDANDERNIFIVNLLKFIWIIKENWLAFRIRSEIFLTN